MVHTHTGFSAHGRAPGTEIRAGKHWRGDIGLAALEAAGAELRERHWAVQKEAGLDFVTVGDFAFYDHVANHIQMLGCEPARFGFTGQEPALSRYFAMARGVNAERRPDPQRGLRLRPEWQRARLRAAPSRWR